MMVLVLENLSFWEEHFDVFSDIAPGSFEVYEILGALSPRVRANGEPPRARGESSTRIRIKYARLSLREKGK